MNRFTIDLLPEAEAEIREAYLWYFERSPLAADAFRTEVFDAIDGLRDRPDMWTSDEHGLRRYVLSRFFYAFHYELADRQVVILAVGHQRKPHYWKRP